MNIDDKENLISKLKKIINADCISVVLSNPKNKEGATKVKARPIETKEGIVFQFTEYKGTQVFHSNLSADKTIAAITKYMEEDFKQGQIICKEETVTVLSGNKGNISIMSRKVKSESKVGLAHNRKKRYILEEGMKIAFLEDLGVMTKEGKIVQKMYDKYRQINRFLEFVEDILPELPTGRELTILDFGCGKSYLTFAMYYYLKILKGREVKMIGLDLKEDVIDKCNGLSRKYGYNEDLKFLKGDIADYDGVDSIDMVVTLHACDTATDYALAKAVKWGASVILSVPCCQHELNKQIESELMQPVFKYGIVKDRMAALLTDALRAEYLENCGYRTQILEFIDMEHTPKNLLIRGVLRKDGSCTDNKNKLNSIESFYNVNPILKSLL
ncbi:MAG: SAM-dependent methyltransferase [Lachnospiraceae bacterium]|nr:SAM-dependent methyltransferase [Lachnospiraceae bacterium]